MRLRLAHIAFLASLMAVLTYASCTSESSRKALSITETQRRSLDPKAASFLNDMQRAYGQGAYHTALALADLQDAPVTALSGSSLREFWQNSVNGLAVKASAANLAVESAGLVRQSLDAQIQSVSGVSLDEEAINLLMFQRHFQAAARFITVIDEMLETLLALG